MREKFKGAEPLSGDASLPGQPDFKKILADSLAEGQCSWHSYPPSLYVAMLHRSPSHSAASIRLSIRANRVVLDSEAKSCLGSWSRSHFVASR